MKYQEILLKNIDFLYYIFFAVNYVVSFNQYPPICTLFSTPAESQLIVLSAWVKRSNLDRDEVAALRRNITPPRFCPTRWGLAYRIDFRASRCIGSPAVPFPILYSFRITHHEFCIQMYSIYTLIFLVISDL